MADEPMDEDDSFHQPVPCSVPFNRQVMTQASPDNGVSDPESDDSFETFAPTQSTGESGRSSGSVPSAESKGPLPQPVSNQPRADLNNQKNAFKPPVASVPFSQLSTQRIGNPMAPAPTFSRFPAPPQPQIPTQIMTQAGIGMHAAITNTRVANLTQKTSAASSTSSSSPNSLARHRSANSGLRNSQVNTPPVRVAGGMLTVRRTPPDIRPSTPIGENKMLKDQLDYEKQKNQKLQSEFQKDTQKNLIRHKKELTDRDEIIRKQEKEIEMLRTANACRKSSGSPVIVKSAPTPTMPSCSEVKKVYPKIPAEPGNIRRTPRRGVHFPQPMSAFRHATKEEDDDTFQLDVSFEPSVTSTPKIPNAPRAGIRRPFDISEQVDVAGGAPTPKRKNVFQPERQRRNREELDKELQKIWTKADEDGMTSSCFFKESGEEKNNDDRMEFEDEENEWIDGYLCKQIRSLDFRKSNEKVTAKARTKILNRAEQKPIQDMRCGCCGIDGKIGEKDGAGCSEKEWESVEKQKMDREKRGAEELRTLQYSTMMQNINRRGIEELEGSDQQKERVEQEYEQKLGRIRKRTLEEIRAEKKEVWRTAIMEELREKGEMNAVLKVEESGRNEDCIWTSDSDDEDWMFPAPYDLNKRILCCDCAHRQRVIRRISKREREKQRLEIVCLQEYGVEQRELLRNMSILTKSKMEAADNELNQHVDDMLASRLFDDEDEDEDIF